MQKCEITLQAGFPLSVCLCVCVCVLRGEWGEAGRKRERVAKCERYKYFERARRRGRKEVGREKKRAVVVPEEVVVCSKCLPAGAVLLSLQEEPRASGGFSHLVLGKAATFHSVSYCDRDGDEHFHGRSWQKEEKVLTDALCQASHLMQFLVLRRNTRCGFSSRCGCCGCVGPAVEKHAESPTLM